MSTALSAHIIRAKKPKYCHEDAEQERGDFVRGRPIRSRPGADI